MIFSFRNRKPKKTDEDVILEITQSIDSCNNDVEIQNCIKRLRHWLYKTKMASDIAQLTYWQVETLIKRKEFELHKIQQNKRLAKQDEEVKTLQYRFN